MKHNMKKILSIILVAAICLTAFPFTVFAEDAHDHEDVAEVMPVCPECLVNTNVTKTDRVITEATCTEATGVWYVCSDAETHHSGTAKEFFKADGKAPAHHSNPEHVTHVAHKDATCSTDGVNEYWHCDVCNKYYKTESMNGAYWIVVTVGDDQVNETVIPATPGANHVYDEDDYFWKNGIEPDCGVTGAIKCSPCQECDFVKEEAVGEEHKWEYVSHKAGLDCTVNTIVTEQCANCQATREVVGEAWNHNFELHNAVTGCDVKVENAYYDCDICGRYFMVAEDGTIPYGELKLAVVEKDAWKTGKYGHVLEEVEAVEVECTADGNIAHVKCTVCEELFLTEEKALNDNEACEADDVVIEAEGHKYTKVDAAESTCVTKGHIEHYTCSGCDLYFVFEANGEGTEDDEYVATAWADIELDFDDHDWKDWNTENEVPDKWVEAVPSTCTTVGNVKYSYCESCKKNYDKDGEELADIRPVPMIPNPNGSDELMADPNGLQYGYVQHTWESAPMKDATCFQNGIISWVCTECDAFSTVDTLVRYATPAFRHKDAIYHAYEANTCVSDGVRGYIDCPDCGGYYLIATTGTTVTVMDDVVVCIDEGESGFIPYDQEDLLVIPAAPNAHPHASEEDDYTFTAEVPATDCDDITGNIAYYTCQWCGENYVADGEGWKNVDSVSNAHTREEVAADTPSCQNDTFAAHIECSCGLWYAADETEFKAENAIAKEEFINSDHSYGVLIAVPTNSCGKAHMIAHYECQIEGCGKFFVKDGDKYVEKTELELTVPATGNHAWGETTGLVECTSTTVGTAGIKECANCGATAGVAQHDYSVKVYVNFTTCVTKGTYKLECSRCHSIELITKEGGLVEKIYEDENFRTHFDASAGNIQHTARVAATCTTTGNIEYWTCGCCGKFFADAAMTQEKTAEELVLATHAEEASEHITPYAERFTDTCGVKEKAQFFCDECDKYSVTEDFQGELSDKPFTFVSATHTDGTNEVALEVVANSHYDSTCLNTGHEWTYKCNGKCGKTFIKVVDGENETYVEATETNVVIAKKAHNGTFVEYVAPTCTTKGVWAHYTACTNGCGLTYFAKDIYATEAEDTSVDDVTKITVGEGDDAEEVVKTWSWDQFPAALGHVQTNENTVAGKLPYCTIKDGAIVVVDGNIAYYVCDRCEKSFASDDTGRYATELEEADIKITHTNDFVESTDTELIEPPTCTEEGYTPWICSCGFAKYVFVPAKGHNIDDSNPGTEPVCGTVGYEEYYFCGDCGVSFKDEALTEVWGTYTDTCDDEDCELNTALAHAKKDREIAKIGFHYNVVGGVKVAIDLETCARDMYYDSDHEVWVVDEAPFICDGCGLPVGINHGTYFTNPDGWAENFVEPNCVNPYTTYYACKICGTIDENTRTYTGEADPDAHITEKRITEGTTKCTDANRLYNWCLICETQIGDAYADTHNWVEIDRDVPLCGLAGTAYFECKADDDHFGCGDTKTEEIPAIDNANHDFEGAVWEDVPGMENDYTSEEAECRKCNNCDFKEYRPHHDIYFSADIDNAVRPGAAIVNTGKVAVTVKVSAYDKAAQAFTLTFKHSLNMTLESAAWSELANKFGILDVDTQLVDEDEDEVNDYVLVTVLAMNLFGDVSFGTEEAPAVVDETFVTLYFNVAHDATGEVAVSDIALTQVVTLAGAVDISAFDAGEDVSAPVAMLGDGNTWTEEVDTDEDGEPDDTITHVGDGEIDLIDLQTLVPLFMNNPDDLYVAQLDFDKDGLNTVNDLTALVDFVTSRDYNALIGYTPVVEA